MIQSSTASHAELQAAELADTARLAYIYGLPGYEVARLRYRALSLPRKGGIKMPLNTFWHTTALTTPGTADVTAVNTDTMLSRAWIDLTQGPLVIDLPSDADRYFSLALMDAYTNNFAVLGSHRDTPDRRRVLLVDPRWDGEPTASMPVIRAPTPTVWALIRIVVDGPHDVAAVCALQQRFGLTRWGHPPAPAVPSPDPLARPVLPLDASKPLVFFDVLNTVLTENPPPEYDRPLLRRLATIGVGPGLRFRRSDFDDAQLQALRRGLASGRESLRAQVGFRTEAARRGDERPWPSDAVLARLHAGTRASSNPGAKADRAFGWSGPVGQVGDFGTDVLLRAQCALAGLGLLPREEAMYFTTATDAAGRLLDGRHRYVVHFPAGRVPPVAAFWSLTAYQSDADNRRWLVPNALDRYSIGNRTALRYEDDGSLTVILQHASPGRNAQNWLPVPEAPFMLTLRAYRPGPDLLDGTYRIPEVALVGSETDAAP